MNTIAINASQTYSVLVGSGILPELGELIHGIHQAEKVAVISDSNVWALYGSCVTKSLHSAGFNTVNFVFPAGEESKNPNTYLQILGFLAENQLTRSDIIVALGGGVVGDITGFAAATYLRGIPYIQVPTTLLAMVDSSVGGKTAIDLPTGKNLVGAFYQPKMVLCDIETLTTLPTGIFCDGCAEIIKYGILYDNALFGHLTSNGLAFDRETVISRCIELKRDVVALDEFDTGARQKLNLGHTIGHAVEAASQYTISHGKAVAIGTAAITRSAFRYNMCSEETVKVIEDVLINFDLPVTTGFTVDKLLETILSDKKRFGGFINLIIPKEIGNCMIHRTAVSELESFIKAGL